MAIALNPLLPVEQSPEKEPAEGSAPDHSSTGGLPASGSRYPVLSRLPEVPGLLADMIAQLPGKVAGLAAPETDLFFQEREDGALEFYPWQFGPGYLLTHPSRQRRLRRSFRRFWGSAGLLVFLLDVALQGAFSIEPKELSGDFELLAAGVGENLVLAGGLGILALLAYTALACRWISGQPEAGRRGFFEQLRRIAETNTTAGLGFVIALGVGFALLGTAMAWKGAVLIGIPYAGLGALAPAAGYQLWWKWKH